MKRKKENQNDETSESVSVHNAKAFHIVPNVAVGTAYISTMRIQTHVFLFILAIVYTHLKQINVRTSYMC